MALSIKDEEVDRTARWLARLDQTSITGAIRKALANEAARRQTAMTEDRVARMRAGIAAARALLAAQPRIVPELTEDEILGYDEDGIPTR